MTKILLVEDDKSLREIYGVRLLAEGYDIVSAGDGEEALAMAIKERPQLIVSDVMMPKISGFDMLDILRSTTETKDIKVIMMTALSSEDQRARGVALGADRYLVKSQVGIEDVVRTVHEVLADAPVAMPSATQTFNTQFNNPAPRPAPVSTVPPRPSTGVPYPQTQVTPTAPFQQQPEPAQPAEVAPQTPSQTNPVPAPSGLPQPTAPFSTNRPANLGDRIIHPLNYPGERPDMSSLIDQELNSNPAPAAPQIQQPSPATVQQPPAEASGINFEEIPRPTPPAPAPFAPGPQPPQV